MSCGHVEEGCCTNETEARVQLKPGAGALPHRQSCWEVLTVDVCHGSIRHFTWELQEEVGWEEVPGREGTSNREAL